MRRSTFLMAALLLWAAPAQAAMPPLKIAQARQASLRGTLKSGPRVEISATVLGNTLQSFSASGLRLGASYKLKLETEKAAIKEGDSYLENKPPTLVIDAQAPMPWPVVFSLLSASDPLASLQATQGVIDPTHHKIETLDEAFVYHYGASPRVVFSRDLSQIRRVFARADGVDWEVRLTGELGVGGLPERIDILRAGAPFANLSLSRDNDGKASKSKR